MKTSAGINFCKKYFQIIQIYEALFTKNPKNHVVQG